MAVISNDKIRVMKLMVRKGIRIMGQGQKNLRGSSKVKFHKPFHLEFNLAIFIAFSIIY